ncbi:DegQ family serine endoprotease [Opitutus sp. ER46]|uniref:DegQ family serine endoprotease n=1 Tax=Opitutus sp. ER46 TaxID=2161864 RepID=UPI000D307E84|nr:DegQ family serine endoprotease [Opitutus sp. ER46]PTY01209.1 peptidase S1 [Opitutus sp. ER46]
MNTTSLFTRSRAAFLAGALAVAGAFVGIAAQNPGNATVSVKRDPQPIKRVPMEPSSFSDVVKRVSPAVVKITTETKAKKMAAQGQELFNDPFFRQFFGNRMPEMRQQPVSGLGSGVVISADGYIVTNNHVVDGADTLNVTFNDGRELTAKVVGRDPQTDVAVIKVDAKGLPAVTFADSDTVEVGDRVLAIGNPFGIGETVTSGIVSAKGRRVGILQDVQGYENFIQTDAAINPGNSGGALVDIQGRLVGMNSAILSRSGGFQGVGFAVPANMVSHVADSLVKNGKVVRGYLGVSIQNLTPGLIESFKLKDNRGALVADVEPNAPAAKAGIKGGDVITKINGKPVVGANELTLAVTSTSPGTKINLEVLRDGDTKEITVTTGQRPNSGKDSESLLSGGDESDTGVLNGVAVDDLSAELREQFNIPARVKGALITNVDPDSAAARAGIRAGNVILEINKKPIRNAQDAVDLTAKTESKKTLVKLWVSNPSGGGSTVFAVVDESDAKDNS